MAHIIFDIGGTKMRVAQKLNESEFSEPIKIETPKGGEEGVEKLFGLAREVAGGEPVESMSGGIAAVFEGKRIVNSSNLPGWIGVDFGGVSEREGVPIIVKNDGAVVGLGEAHFGAGKGERIVVYITVSTGVGGAKIIDGKVSESALGFEPGHQIIDIRDGKTLEDMVSGRGFEERYHKKPYEVTESEAWEEAARTLAVGLHNTIVHWSPDVVVLGGPMMVGDPSIPIESVKRHLSEVSRIFTKLPELRLASLVDNGGLYGALALSRSL